MLAVGPAGVGYPHGTLASTRDPQAPEKKAAAPSMAKHMIVQDMLRGGRQILSTRFRSQET